MILDFGAVKEGKKDRQNWTCCWHFKLQNSTRKKMHLHLQVSGGGVGQDRGGSILGTRDNGNWMGWDDIVRSCSCGETCFVKGEYGWIGKWEGLRDTILTRALAIFLLHRAIRKSHLCSRLS